jgi:hypothetical protein
VYLPPPPHVNLSLIGIFKQEYGEHQNFLPVATVMGSGLRLIKWMERLVDEKGRLGESRVRFSHPRRKGC